MNKAHSVLTRRTLFAAGALGVAVIAGLGAGADAADAGAMEKANEKLVRTFLKAWEGKSVDPNKLGAFLAEDCMVRLDLAKPAAMGRAAAVESFKPFLANNQTYTVKIVKILAKGAVIVTSRIDTTMAPGKPDMPAAMMGVFYIKDGKIKEWTDYPAM